MLCVSLETNAQGFLLNDTTYCTSVEEIEGWANDKIVLKAEKEYLKTQLAVERVGSENLKKDLNAIRRKLFWLKFRTPAIGVISLLTGYGVGRL